MTMHVNLSPEMESFIKGQVAGGFYGNATEVVRDAIRRMQAEEIRTAGWQAAVALGADQLDRGEGVDYSPGELDDITQNALAAMNSSRPIDADVQP